MSDLIAWVVVIIFSMLFPLILLYSMGYRYDHAGQKRSTPRKILNGLLNVSCICAFIAFCIGFILLIIWAFETVMGA